MIMDCINYTYNKEKKTMTKQVQEAREALNRIRHRMPVEAACEITRSDFETIDTALLDLEHKNVRISALEELTRRKANK